MYVPLMSDSVPKTIKETQLLRELGSLHKKTQDTAKLYLALGGDKSLNWPDDKPMGSIIDELKAKSKALVDKELEEIAKRDQKDKRVSLDINAYFSEDYNSVKMVLTAVVGGYYALCLGDLDRSKKCAKKSAVYNFVKRVLIALHRTAPTYSVRDFYDWREDMFEEMQGEEEPESIEAMQKELQSYLDFVEQGAYSDKKLMKGMRAAYKKARRHLGTEERAWSETALEMIEYFSNYSDKFLRTKKLPFMNSDESQEDEPVLAMHMFFCLLWEEGGILSDWMIEDLNNEAGEYGPPMVKFHIQSKQDVEVVKRFLRGITLLEIVMFDASRLFNI